MAKARPAARPARPAGPAQGRSTRTLVAAGASTFGATILLVAGLSHFVEGLVVLLNGPEFLVKATNYVFTFNATGWGWFHMIVGASAAVAGAFIFTGNLLARSAGIAISVISALSNFLFLPQYPVWATIIIALDVLVIWGLTSVDLGEL